MFVQLLFVELCFAITLCTRTLCVWPKQTEQHRSNSKKHFNFERRTFFIFCMRSFICSVDRVRSCLHRAFAAAIFLLRHNNFRVSDINLLVSFVHFRSLNQRPFPINLTHPISLAIGSIAELKLKERNARRETKMPKCFALIRWRINKSISFHSFIQWANLCVCVHWRGPIYLTISFIWCTEKL